MVEDAYISLIRRAYQDFESGDLDLLRVVMAPDVVWHEPGRSILAGDYKGPEAVLEFLGQLKARSNGTFKVEVLDVLSEPERAVVFQRETATRNGKCLDVIAAVDFEIHHQKITEVTVYHADIYEFDEFWTRTAMSESAFSGGAQDFTSVADVTGLQQCPKCGSKKLIPVHVGARTNFFCEDCVFCWHLESGRVTVVDPQTCPGCELGTTACFELWQLSHWS